MLRGGCFCGYIRYEAASGAFHEANCHCSICRRTTGAPFVAWFSVRREAFRILSGKPQQFQSSTHATRSFCARCGTQLTFEHRDFLDEVDVTLCSLDDPTSIRPKAHIHTSSKLTWVQLADGLPEFPEQREDN